MHMSMQIRGRISPERIFPVSRKSGRGLHPRLQPPTTAWQAGYIALPGEASPVSLRYTTVLTGRKSARHLSAGAPFPERTGEEA